MSLSPPSNYMTCAGREIHYMEWARRTNPL